MAVFYKIFLQFKSESMKKLQCCELHVYVTQSTVLESILGYISWTVYMCMFLQIFVISILASNFIVIITIIYHNVAKEVKQGRKG